MRYGERVIWRTWHNHSSSTQQSTPFIHYDRSCKTIDSRVSASKDLPITTTTFSPSVSYLATVPRYRAWPRICDARRCGVSWHGPHGSNIWLCYCCYGRQSPFRFQSKHSAPRVQKYQSSLQDEAGSLIYVERLMLYVQSLDYAQVRHDLHDHDSCDSGFTASDSPAVGVLPWRCSRWREPRSRTACRRPDRRHVLFQHLRAVNDDAGEVCYALAATRLTRLFEQ